MQYFLQHPHKDALTFHDHNLVKYIRSILKVVRDLQQWTEGEYVTSSGCWTMIQEVIEYLRGNVFCIIDSPVTKAVVEVRFVDMPVLIQQLVRNLATNLALYFPPVPTDEELLAAWLDPRGKDLCIVTELSGRAKILFEELLFTNAISKFTDDEGCSETTSVVDVGAAEAAAADVQPPKSKKGRHGFNMLGSFESSNAATASVRQAPQPTAAAVTVPKSAEQKAREEVKATIEAWVAVPAVDKPFMGEGSSGFDLLDYWGSMDLGAGTDAAKQVAFAAFGWKASADGPERIFSSASLWSTALKNGYSVWMLELMVFLKKNKAFMPTTEQVVAEMAQLQKAKRAAKTKARAAAKSQASATADAAPAGDSPAGDLAGEVSDEEGEGGLPLEDSDPTTLSEDEVHALLDSIAEFRGDSDEDADEEFLAFVRSLASDDAPEYSCVACDDAPDDNGE